MILSDSQISSILKDNPAKARLLKAREYSKKLRKHIYGEKLAEQMEGIEQFERPSLKDTRTKWSKSNKDVFCRLSRPMDKVFSARGGSVYYNLSEQAEKKAMLLAQDVDKGLSIRKWVENIWKPHMLDDPNGIILLELMATQDAVKARSEGRSFVYPVYKSTSDIYDYLPKGNKLEYLVLMLSAEDKQKEGFKSDDLVYRVIDDAFDRYVLVSGENVTNLPSYQLPNYFGEVPAMINSDIIDPISENCFLSLYDEVIELAEHFLLKGSIKLTHDFLHGFPKYVEFASDCSACNGEKYVNGKPCETCKGSGKKTMTRASDVKLLEFPSGKDAAMILPADVAAYISPDKTYYEIATNDLQLLEDAMNVTLWGTQSRLKSTGMTAAPGTEPKTATQIVDEMKPQSDRLIPVSEMAETRHKFILDAVVKLQVLPSYSGSSVNYGRRYILESPDSLLEKYNKARADGAPQNVLDGLLNEYYESNYQNDLYSLGIAKKLMYVEPFVHYTSLQLKALDPDPVDYKMKLYYPEWLSTINDAQIIGYSVDELKQQLMAYTESKKLPAETKQLPAA